jgi:hypothetical protein
VPALTNREEELAPALLRRDASPRLVELDQVARLVPSRTGRADCLLVLASLFCGLDGDRESFNDVSSRGGDSSGADEGS